MQLRILLAVLPFLASSVSSHPITTKREVPQEHSHEPILTKTREMLNLDNPAGITDVVFGLLGNAAAAAGQGSITNTDCLQQATADQAFTNAKAAGDVAGMVAALTYRALERNTGKVGLASVLCTESAANAGIAALSQHQDPTSDGAAATNEAITLELSRQIAAVGGDPQDALKAGTFAPGDVNDATGAGSTCDNANDSNGCIFTQDLLVEDATAEEIAAAVGGSGAGNATAPGATGGNVALQTGAATANATACPIPVETGADAIATGVNGAEAGATNSSDTTPANNAAATGIDFGPCTDFSMTFAAGLDGRKADEFSFEPTDLSNFNHGTALNPAIISQFMCDTFVNACAKSATTRDTTDIDNQLAAGTLAKDQTYADAWLSGLEAAFGIQSTGTGTGSGTASPGAATGDATAIVTTATATDAADTTITGVTTTNTALSSAVTASATATAAAAIGAAADNDAASINNVQTFTGAVNGVSVPAVAQDATADRTFSVNGATFLNQGAALQRSCAIQHNGCADAANSGGTASVAECDAQETQCNAAGRA